MPCEQKYYLSYLDVLHLVFLLGFSITITAQSFPTLPVEIMSLELDYLEEINENVKSETLAKNEIENLRQIIRTVGRSGDLQKFRMLDTFAMSYVELAHRDSFFYRKLYSFLGYYSLKPLGQVEYSIDLLLKAHRFGGDLHEVHDSWDVENGLGIRYHIKGDLERAIYFYKIQLRRQLEIANSQVEEEKRRQQAQVYAGRTFANLGKLLLSMGQMNEAEEHIRKGFGISSRVKFHKGIAASSAYMIMLYVEKNNTDSLERYLNELDLVIPKLEPEIQYLYKSEWYQGKSKLENLLGRVRNSIEFKLKAINHAQKDNLNFSARDFGKLYAQLAMLYMNEDSLDQASHYIKEGLRQFDLPEMYPTEYEDYLFAENTFAELYSMQVENFSKYYHDSNNVMYLDSSLQCINAVLYVYDLLRDQILFTKSKLHLTIPYRRVVNIGIDLLWEKKNAGGSIKETLLNDLFARSKGQLLTQARIKRRIYHSLDYREKEIVDSISLHIANWAEFGVIGMSQVQKDSLDELKVKAKVAMEGYFDYVHISPGLELYENSIEYLFTDQSLYARANINGQLSFEKLIDRQYFDSLVDISLAGVKNKTTTGEFYSNQYELYRLLLGHFEPLPIKLNILPDDRICFLSLAGLINDLEKKRYVVEDVFLNMTYGNSISMTTTDKEVKDLVAILPSYKTLGSINSDTRGGLYHLPYAEDEVRAIAAEWDHPIKVVNQNFQSELPEAIKEADIMHYTGHAIVSGDQGVLVLSSDSSAMLTDNQISNLPSGVSTVVLSACETGLGDIEMGEGVGSLANSFLMNGVQSLVYTLWAINDQISSSIMRKFYKNYSRDRNIVESLALAQRAHLAGSAEKYRHPYYWAAFQVTNTCTVDNKSMNLRSLMVIVFALSLVISLILIKFFK